MFIVIEGMDNSGKTTLINSLKDALFNNPLILEKFPEICFTSEPYGPRKREWKFIELSKPLFSDAYSLSSETEALLFLAIRNEHLNTFIKPKLREKSLIICDRYFLSTLAYQSYLKKVDVSWLNLTMEFISKGLKPHLVFVLDIDEESWKRNTEFKKLKKELNKLDCLPLTYKELSEAYKWASDKLKKNGENIINISSSFSLDEKVRLVINKIIELSRTE